MTNSGISFGEEESRQVESLYHTGDAVKRRKAVLRALALAPGESVIDIGTGPGFVALEMAEAVGPNGRVLAIDRSEPMLTLAKRRCGSVPQVELRSGDATDLPCDDQDFDVAVSVQVYEYVAEIGKALAEMFRALKPGGRAAIVATDWDSILWHSGDAERMARVMSAWEEHLHDPRLPRTLMGRLREAGFTITGHDVISQFNPDYREDTYSVGLIPLIAAFVSGRHGLTTEDTQAWVADLQDLGEHGEYFFCLNQFLFNVTKPAA
jgi:ubiquinone/menaquinone biosynthesis C-methylase UbiE